MTAPRKKQTCEICGGGFFVKPYREGKARFCSQVCGGKWHAKTRLSKIDKGYMKGNQLRAGLRPTNSFESGHEPWNKDIKGIHLNPATEFKKGQLGVNWLPVGSETVRIDQNGKPRAFVKTAEPNVWECRSVVVWESTHGCTVPENHIVHHRDRDSLNDVSSNLELLTRAEHIEEHRNELERSRRSAAE